MLAIYLANIKHFCGNGILLQELALKAIGSKKHINETS